MTWVKGTSYKEWNECLWIQGLRKFPCPYVEGDPSRKEHVTRRQSSRRLTETDWKKPNDPDGEVHGGLQNKFGM